MKSRRLFLKKLGLVFVASIVPMSGITSIIDIQTYYIDGINGNDNNNGRSKDSPFKTVNALDKIGGNERIRCFIKNYNFDFKGENHGLGIIEEIHLDSCKIINKGKDIAFNLGNNHSFASRLSKNSSLTNCHIVGNLPKFVYYS